MRTTTGYRSPTQRWPGSAFTLAEIVVATAILGAALVPLFLMQSAALGGARASQPALMARAAAQEVADQLRTLPFSCLPVDQPFAFSVAQRSDVSTAAVSLPGPSPIPLAFGSYPFDARVEIRVDRLDPPQRLARLTVLVTGLKAAGGSDSQYRHVELIENRKSAEADE